MKLTMKCAVLAARFAVAAAFGSTAALAQAKTGAAPTAAGEQFFPVLSYRTGPFAPNGVPFANGFVDYLKLAPEHAGKSTELHKNPLR